MNRRMTVATSVAAGVTALGVLAGCGSDEKPSAPLTQPTQTSAAPSGAPTTQPTEAQGSKAPASASDLVGDWSDKAAQWTVHFKQGGSYTMDYQGVEDFTSGRYSLASGKVTLSGGDGDMSQGTVKGDGIVFKLGTLTRDAQ